MTLDKTNIFHFLIDKKLMGLEQAVRGNVVAIDMQQRNKNIKVLYPDGNGFFVKQILKQDPIAILTLRREAACYQLAASTSSFSHLKDIIPDYLFFDDKKNVLITKVIAQGVNLTQYHYQQNKFDQIIANKIGSALGRYHDKVEIGQVDQSIFTKDFPWVLNYHQQAFQQFPNMKNGTQQIHQIINDFPDFIQKIEALKTEWKCDALIHGDMKWDNIMVFNNKGELDIRIIDWELANLGDKRWDIGAVIQSYLSFWIVNMPQDHSVSSQDLIANARFKLEDMQPSIRGFWDAYLKEINIGKNQENELLENSVRFAAVRMIQTAFEYLQGSEHMSPFGINMLQVSLNILSQPKDAIKQLLGIRI